MAATIGDDAAFYHGEMSDNERLETQRKWMSNQVKIICATIGEYDSFVLIKNIMNGCAYSLRDGNRQARRPVRDSSLASAIYRVILSGNWQVGVILDPMMQHV